MKQLLLLCALLNAACALAAPHSPNRITFPPDAPFMMWLGAPGHTPAGKLLSPQQLYLRPFVPVAGQPNTFEVAGIGKVITSPSHLTPLYQDTELRQMQRKYMNKVVYLRSGGPYCFTPNKTNVNFMRDGLQGVKVLGVYRLQQDYSVDQTGRNSGVGPWKGAAHAYMLIFDTSSGLRTASMSGEGGDGSPGEREMNSFHDKKTLLAACSRALGEYSDPQMLERFISLTPPPKSILGFSRGQLVGRAAQEALWVAGVPDLTPGTPAQLYRLSEWNYSELPLGGQLQLRGGKVTLERWPSLP